MTPSLWLNSQFNQSTDYKTITKFIFTHLGTEASSLFCNCSRKVVLKSLLFPWTGLGVSSAPLNHAEGQGDPSRLL